MDISFIGMWRSACTFSIVFLLFLSCSTFTPTEATNHLNPKAKGNITIKWDVLNWTPDGYVAVVSIYNFQKKRGIEAPGWRLGWTWARKEVIWSIVGAQAEYQGDCSKFKGNIPHSCIKTPAIVDLMPGTPYNQQVENCCKGGVLTSWSQKNHQATWLSQFQISVGLAGTTPKTVKLPMKFVFEAPRAAYTCGPAKIVRPSRFISQDKRRVTRAFMTWKVACLYSSM